METKYERKVDHCEVSPYIKNVTIASIKHAENSDNLDSVSFHEIGWNCLVRRDSFKEGDTTLFIPPESVLPFELSEKLEITKYLSKGKVRITRLRGNRSEGLIVDKEIVEPYIPFILKWEDLPSITMGGKCLSQNEVNPYFEKFYKIPNILNEPFTFEVGERLFYSCKIHGTNARCGYLLHPRKEDYEFYVGTHNTIRKESENDLWWKVLDKFKGKLPKDVIYYGEIFGEGIQHLHYDRKEPDILFFNSAMGGNYRVVEELLLDCLKYNLPCINFHEIEFEDLEQIRQLADLPSEYTKSHHREGIVLVSKDRPSVMAKCISMQYLLTKNRSERH